MISAVRHPTLRVHVIQGVVEGKQSDTWQFMENGKWHNVLVQSSSVAHLIEIVQRTSHDITQWCYAICHLANYSELTILLKGMHALSYNKY